VAFRTLRALLLVILRIVPMAGSGATLDVRFAISNRAAGFSAR
jgi:hypothetical protein